jgi:AraC-like DNA-binding protein
MKIQFIFCVKQGNSRIGYHTHNALEIVYYVDGEGFSTFQRKRHTVRKNHFCILPEDTLHDQENLGNLTCVCLGLVHSGLDAFAGCYADPDGRLRLLFENLLHEAGNKDAWSDRIISGMADEAVGRIQRLIQTPAVRPGKQVLVTNALELIRNRDGRISLDEIADTLYVSKDYLRHLFRGHSELSPVRHIINARIRKAKNLLLDGRLSVKQVAGQCGFDDTYYFLRIFKKVTGSTPSAYRKIQTGKSIG